MTSNIRQNNNQVFIDITQDIKPYEGQLTIKSIDKKGNVFIYKTPNIITYAARTVMSKLLVGDSVSTYKLTKLAIGLDGTIPTRNDVTLGNELLQVPFTSYTYPDVGHVEMTSIIDFVSPANGQILREAGLFCGDGTTLFARQVYGAITKTPSLQLQYIWRIIYT